MLNFLYETALAHEAEVPHEEPVSDAAEVEPIYLVGAVIVVGVIAFLVWKFLLKK